MTVRVTEAQAALLFGGACPHCSKPSMNCDCMPTAVRGAKKPQPRVRKRKDELPENQLESQIRGLLEARGWSMTRNHVGTFIPTGIIMRAIEGGIPLTKETLFRSLVRVGEKGIPDWRAERVVRVAGLPAAVQAFYWEAKAPGKKPRPEQTEWIGRRRTLGWEVEYFDDFDFGGQHSFMDWYRGRFGE